MSNSKLVLASKYLLEIPDGIKSGRFKTKESSRKLIHKKLVDRLWALGRIESGLIYDDKGKVEEGIRSNNELYVFHEEETKKSMAKREINLVKNAEQLKNESVGMHELVNVIANKLNSSVPSSVHFTDSMSEEQLKEYCDEKKINYHPNSGKNKLIELIKS